MDIKEILLNGGYVTLNYKENKKALMSSAKIISFSGGFGMSPKIILEIPTLEIKGRKEFDFKDIDLAINLFEKIVFSEKNLCYKMHQAMINLVENDLDLDIKDDFELMETERLRLIKDNG
jgi:hypothetical protein